MKPFICSFVKLDKMKLPLRKTRCRGGHGLKQTFEGEGGRRVSRQVILARKQTHRSGGKVNKEVQSIDRK